MQYIYNFILDVEKVKEMPLEMSNLMEDEIVEQRIPERIQRKKKTQQSLLIVIQREGGTIF